MTTLRNCIWTFCNGIDYRVQRALDEGICEGIGVILAFGKGWIGVGCCNSARVAEVLFQALVDVERDVHLVEYMRLERDAIWCVDAGVLM